jgi:phage shock protein C
MNGANRLTRSRSDKMIAGVAGGIARYLGTDPVLVRLVFVLLAFSGPGLLIYPLLALVMPKEPASGLPAAAPGEPGQVFVAEGTKTQRLRIDPMTGAPNEPQEIPINNVGQAADRQASAAGRNQLLGYVLLGLGGFLVLQMLIPGVGHLLFPALLIGAGVYLLRRP